LIDTLLNHGTADGRQHLTDDAPHDHDRMVQSVRRRAKALG
jgi:hypothetical protein